MPITTKCPGCQSLFRLPDLLAGKQVRCQKCGQMFVMPASAPDVAEPMVAAPEMPSPAAEEPILATIPAEPAEEIVTATLLDPKEEQPRAEVKPPPLPTPVPPERPASLVWALALLILFVLGMIGTGTAAALWVSANLSDPVRVTFAPPLNAAADGKRDFRFDDGRFKDKDGPKRPAAVPEQIFVDPNDKASLNGRTNQAPFVDHGKWNQDGPYQLLRVHLKAGKTYHFHVVGFGFLPRLRVLDGDAFVVADQLAVAPAHRLMFAYQARRNGDHLLWVTTREAFAGQYFLSLAPVVPTKPIQVDLAATPNFVDRRVLQVEDPLDPAGNQFGPYREYEVSLEANVEYTFKVANTPYTPVLQIFEKERVVNGFAENFPSRIEFHYRAPFTGKFRVRVTSQQFGLGAYTFNVARKGEGFFEKRVVSILGTLNANHSFEDRRVLKETDANEPNLVGRGVYKEYWITLERGKKYRIEMISKDFLSTLTLFDSNGHQIERVSGMKNAILIHDANPTGTYRIHAAAHLPKDRGEYTLRITLEP